MAFAMQSILRAFHRGTCIKGLMSIEDQILEDIYSLCHRKCGVGDFIYEMFVPNPKRARYERVSDFAQISSESNPVQSAFYDINCLLHVSREFSL